VTGTGGRRAAPRNLGARKWIITFTVVLASMIELIDVSIVNVALPQMMGNLGAGLDDAAWVVTAYVVANVIVVPMAGWLAARLGRRNYFAGSIVLFTVASVLCGQADGIWSLVFFRFVQGIGGGALLATSQAILVETFPPEELGLATGLFGLGVVVGPTIGPTLGGWITDNYSWPWIFYINVPIGVVATLLTVGFITDDAEAADTTQGVDWWGILLLTIGIGALQILLERGEAEDWFESRTVIALAAAAVIGIAAFVARELTTEHPIVDLRVLRDRSLALGAMFSFVLGFGIYASVFVFPVFAQALLGFTAMQTGLVLLPGAIATAFMMPVVGKLLQRGASARLFTAIGFGSLALFAWIVSLSTLSSGRVDFFWPLIFRGLGVGLVFVPLTTLALANLKGPQIAQGAGLTAMMRQLGGSFGVALISTYIARAQWEHRAELVTHVTRFDAAVTDRLGAWTSALVARGLPEIEAQRAAYGQMARAVVRQTLLLSYMDAFRLMAFFFLAGIPLLILFKKGRGGHIDVVGH
jgi:MFS transporter, DHA2 family, multidrug resistance protein